MITHVPGRTSQTTSRDAQDFTRPVHLVDLDQESEALLLEAAGNPSHRAAKTLSKDPSMAVTILAMTAGTEVRDHRAHGSAILQTLRGQVTVSLTDTELQLQPGQLVALARQVPHWLRADVDSVALLVVTADPT